MLAQALTAPAYAESKPLTPFNITAKYNVAFNGITIGRIRLTATEDATRYKLSVDTKTHGIGAIFSNEKRIATAEGTHTAEGRYIPIRYQSTPQDEEKDGRHTTLIYDAEGKIKTRERVPDDDPKYRPPVPPEEINRATDSVTAGLVLRRQLYALMEKEETTTSARTYDGARLAEMKLTLVKSDTRVQVANNYVPAVNTVVTRQPLNGYTAKELKKFKAGDPEIHLYFSADEKFIPIKVTIDSSFGQLSATLEKIEN